MCKNHPYIPSPRKMPLLTTICSYAFSGVNVCAAGITIKASHPHYDAFYIFGIGVAFFLMVPITLADKRKENRDARYALYAGIMHLGICVYLSYVMCISNGGYWCILLRFLSISSSAISSKATIGRNLIRAHRDRGRCSRSTPPLANPLKSCYTIYNRSKGVCHA